MKLNANATHVKVPLAALRVTGNVRKDFNQDEIESLARSIKADGLLNPITVRPPVEDENGNKTYEVIAGGRRIRAHQWLCDNGDDFSMIECCVRTGDTWTLQMVENIQRADLTPREKEEAVTAALESGLTMTQIAEKLSKPVQYVSDIVAGTKVRHAADEAGIATERISTKALSQLRSIPAESLPEAIGDLAKSGGTVKEATRILNERKEAANPHLNVLEPGAFVNKAGDRLFFDDIFVGEFFTHKDDMRSAQYLKVFQVTKKGADFITATNGERADFCLRRKYIDGDSPECDRFIYAIPADAKTTPESSTQDDDDPFDIEPEIEAEEVNAPQKNHDVKAWRINTQQQTEHSFFEEVWQAMRKTPAETKIVLKHYGRIVGITEVEFRPSEGKVIFYSTESEHHTLG